MASRLIVLSPFQYAENGPGCNAPGIFRVSGTATTVNALYNYFDHQFSDAGSPSKVEETVVAGLLPSEPEYTLTDIASLFKKIIIGLPGGLLGSLELFKVLRSVLLNWNANPEMSTQDTMQLRARMIALAISSVSSLYRVYLIQAVVGLVAYFGSEGDKAQAAEKIVAKSQKNQTGSEIMGYHSLSVVFGPLLLGDLTDHIEVGDGDARNQDSTLPRNNSAEHDEEHTKKSKKQKRASVLNKVDKDATLSAHVDRANLTADVMHLLIINWKEVVEQLRDLNGLSNSTSELPRSKYQNRRLTSQGVSRVSLRDSDEEMRFLELLQGRALPLNLQGPIKMKSTVRIRSRSPMFRDAMQVSEGSNAIHAWPTMARGEQDDAILAKDGATQPTATQGPRSAVSLSLDDPQVPSTEDVPGLPPDKRTKSELAMNMMSMGTILTPPKDSSAAPKQTLHSRSASPTGTPIKQSRTRSSSYVPETAIRMVPTPAQRQASLRAVKGPITDKPLPPISDSQRAELLLPFGNDDADKVLHERILSSRRSRRSRASTESSPFATRRPTPRSLFPSRESEKWTPPPLPKPEEEAVFPSRQSSLQHDQGLATRVTDSLSNPNSLQEYNKVRSSSGATFPGSSPVSRKASKVRHLEDQASDEAKKDSTGSVKLLAQKFAEASRAARNSEQARPPFKAVDIPVVYAYVHPLPSTHSLSDPFVPSANVSPPRETMIPKPVKNIGRGRKAENSVSPRKTPSPPKQTAPLTSGDYLQRRSSVYNIVHDEDAEIMRANGNAETSTLHNESNPDRQIASAQTTRLMSSDHSASRGVNEYSGRPFSYEYPSDVEGIFDEASPGSQNHTDTIPIGDALCSSQPDAPALARGYLTQTSPSRINSFNKASDALTKLKRHGSLNATLYQEIMRLQRLLEQRGEEVQAARRSLDAVKEATEARDPSPSKAASSRGSWSKGMWNEEVKEARREVNLWKRRAEEAEGRLADIEGSTRNIPKKHGVAVDVSMHRVPNEDHGEKKLAFDGDGVNVEVLLDRDGGRPESVVDLYVDEGWGSGELQGNVPFSDD